MVIYCISGKENCSQFKKAVYVVNYLKKKFTEIEFHIQEHKNDEWEPFVDNLNNTQQWSCNGSPIIWRKESDNSTKMFLIGTYNDFLDYCFDYYGLDTCLSQKNYKLLITSYTIQPKKEILSKYIFSIIGGDENSISLLLQEKQFLLEDPKWFINLYNEQWAKPKESYSRIIDQLKANFSDIYNKIAVVSNFEKAMKNCRILLILDYYFRKEPNQNINEWLESCAKNILKLADPIDKYCDKETYILFCTDGCDCFNATILMNSCTSVRLRNILAITSHQGISMLNVIAQETELPCTSIGCPPVWGAPGLITYVDLKNTIYACDVYNPRNTKKLKTKLPKGDILKELRLLDTHLNDGQLIIEKTENINISCTAKIKAVGNALEYIYDRKRYKDQVIALGICSNHSFGIPPRIVFSQPAVLDRDGVWKPFRDFPVTPDVDKKIKSVFEEFIKYLKIGGIEI